MVVNDKLGSTCSEAGIASSGYCSRYFPAADEQQALERFVRIAVMRPSLSEVRSPQL
jgi:hypothetical protein